MVQGLEISDERILITNPKIIRLFKQMFSMYGNFISGHSEPLDDDGMPKEILVTKSPGCDGMVLYEKKGKYSVPSY